MDLKQEIKYTDDRSPALTRVVKQFFDHFSQKANDRYKFSNESSNATGINLHNLNEDCLQEIFSKDLLTPMDFCSLAETCKRFKQITQRMFSKKFIDESGQFNYETKKIRGRGKRARDAERILKNFGSCISAFSIDLKTDKPLHVLNLVTKYCAGTLDRLKISAIYPGIPNRLIVKLKPIFQRLLLLHIGYIDAINFGKEIFACCDSLIELKVSQVIECDSILKNIFPKLERFSFFFDYDCFNYYDFDALHNIFLQFITRHKSLKVFKLDINKPPSSYKPLYLQAIGNNCRELEELKITLRAVDKDNFSELHGLDQLRLLDISLRGLCGSKDIECIPQLQALKSLETLIISNSYDDQFILLRGYNGSINVQQFYSLTQLKKLHLYAKLVGNAVDLIRKLINLEELTIDNPRFELNEKMFFEIVEIVKERPKGLTLKCKFEFLYNLKNCDRKLRLINTKR